MLRTLGIAVTSAALVVGGLGSPAASSAGASADTTAVVGVPAKAPAASAPRPAMRRKLIAFPKSRLRQTARYSERHYGERRWRLSKPRVIVQHYTDGPSMLSAWWTMANNSPNLGERPGVCTHFIIDKRGRIFRTVPLGIRCRHTIGLNQTAIGIEHVGFSSRSVFRHERQRKASYRLTLWLMDRYDIAVRNVIGHGESLQSPLRYERYRSWRCLTHVDFSRPAMRRYRGAIRVRAAELGLRIGPKPNWVDPGC